MKSIKAKICNLLVTCCFGCKIDLGKVRNFVKSTRHPVRFSGLTVKFEKPKATVVLFSTGKANCLGIKTKNDAANVFEATNRILKYLGHGTKMSKPAVRSMVVGFGLGERIDLYKFAENNAKNTVWNQEIFPMGLTYYFDRKATKKLSLAYFILEKLIFVV